MSLAKYFCHRFRLTASWTSSSKICRQAPMLVFDASNSADALPASNVEVYSTTGPSSSDSRQSALPAAADPPPNNGHSQQRPPANAAQEPFNRSVGSRAATPTVPPSAPAAPAAPSLPGAAKAPAAASKGRTLIPTDIPKMGGARPKQTGSVHSLTLPDRQCLLSSKPTLPQHGHPDAAFSKAMA